MYDRMLDREDPKTGAKMRGGFGSKSQEKLKKKERSVS